MLEHVYAHLTRCPLCDVPVDAEHEQVCPLYLHLHPKPAEGSPEWAEEVGKTEWVQPVGRADEARTVHNGWWEQRNGARCRKPSFMPAAFPRWERSPAPEHATARWEIKRNGNMERVPEAAFQYAAAMMPSYNDGTWRFNGFIVRWQGKEYGAGIFPVVWFGPRGDSWHSTPEHGYPIPVHACAVEMIRCDAVDEHSNK
jgi:hypothetical protein